MLTDDPEGRPVRKIVFNHDGVRYTAEIGKTIRRRRYSSDRKKARLGIMEPESGNYVVRIESGTPWRIYLDPLRNDRYWQNPFMVGEPSILDIGY